MLAGPRHDDLPSGVVLPLLPAKIAHRGFDVFPVSGQLAAHATTNT
jgi:hypothetical protein